MMAQLVSVGGLSPAFEEDFARLEAASSAQLVQVSVHDAGGGEVASTAARLLEGRDDEPVEWSAWVELLSCGDEEVVLEHKDGLIGVYCVGGKFWLMKQGDTERLVLKTGQAAVLDLGRAKLECLPAQEGGRLFVFRFVFDVMDSRERVVTSESLKKERARKLLQNEADSEPRKRSKADEMGASEEVDHEYMGEDFDLEKKEEQNVEVKDFETLVQRNVERYSSSVVSKIKERLPVDVIFTRAEVLDPDSVATHGNRFMYAVVPDDARQLSRYRQKVLSPMFHVSFWRNRDRWEDIGRFLPKCVVTFSDHVAIEEYLKTKQLFQLPGTGGGTSVGLVLADKG